MHKWKAHYSDNKHDLDLLIENDFPNNNIFSSLTMVIDDIAFCGMSFDDWEVYSDDDIKIASERFSIMQWSSKESDSIHYALRNYRLEVEIPIPIIDIAQGKCIQGIIHFDFIRENDKCNFFNIRIEDEIFECDNANSDFETSLLQICKKIKEKYLLKCCFGCLYSDYSPYGNGNFSSMLCFLSVADQYRHVSGKYKDTDGKISIWEVYENGEQKQETFLCDGFIPRTNCLGGYRGLIY